MMELIYNAKAVAVNTRFFIAPLTVSLTIGSILIFLHVFTAVFVPLLP